MPATRPEQRPQPGIHEERSEQERKRDRHDAVQTFVGLALVFFGLGQVIVGGLQWDATDKQWEVMRLDQRPWLSFELPTIGEPKLDQHIEGTISIKNTGKTPATIIGFAAIPAPIVGGGPLTRQTDDIFAEYFFVSLDIEHKLAVMRDTVEKVAMLSFGEHKFSPEYVLIPGDSLAVTIKSPQPLDIEGMEVLGDDGYVAIVVYVKYLDAASEIHESWSCFVYDPATKTVQANLRHNHMD